MSKEGIEILQSMNSSLAAIKDGIEVLVGRKKSRPKQQKTIVDDWFEELWAQYPRREGKKMALKHFKNSVGNEEDKNRFKDALYNYKNYASTLEPQYIKTGSTFFNNWEDYLDLSTKSHQDQLVEWAKELEE